MSPYITSLGYVLLVGTILFLHLYLLYKLMHTPGFGEREKWICQLGICGAGIYVMDIVCVAGQRYLQSFGCFWSNAAYFILLCVFCVLLFRYTEELYYGKANSPFFIIMTIPMLVIIVMIFLSYWTGWIWSVDENIHYIRGPYYYLMIDYMMSYLIFIPLLSCIRLFFPENSSKRNELVRAIIYTTPVWSLMWLQINIMALPFISMSILILFNIIFVDNQHRLYIETLELAEERLRYMERMSITDGLTGLKNRRGMRAVFPSCLGKNIAITMLDIDDFKNFNDLYGHETGDRVLKEVSTEILKYRSDTFSAFRFGGDEFLLWDTCGDEKLARQKLENISKEIEKIQLNNSRESIHISYGMAFGIPKSEKELRELQNEADMRLYEVKQKKGSR